jgi:hypothetical protein
MQRDHAALPIPARALVPDGVAREKLQLLAVSR